MTDLIQEEGERRFNAVAAEQGMQYVWEIPTAIPPGCYLFHNQAPVGRIGKGFGDFHAWFRRDLPFNAVPCGCGWAPRLPCHYRLMTVRKAD